MKKIFYSLIFLFLFSLSAAAQNYVHRIIIIPARFYVQALININNEKLPKPGYKITNLNFPAGNQNSFLSTLPLIVLKERSARLPVLLFSELSLNDMLENTVNGLNANLLLTYDDNITELFKDAPSLVKLKCIIPF